MQRQREASWARKVEVGFRIHWRGEGGGREGVRRNGGLEDKLKTKTGVNISLGGGG